ncbi:uncharacterized protein LOC9658925 [Selaginella moellendorffii]|nr:uncharacterized protein LOC9658925 [Selaginella moellendorffii]|eukprot:XP_002969160.2 uncharacterized protein LOC9658925 [Selaginella moellendorffii]
MVVAAPWRAFPFSWPRPRMREISHSCAFSSATLLQIEDSSEANRAAVAAESEEQPAKKVPFFPKRGQELELVCESLAFKGQGVCKVLETGYVVMCDRALPGERLIARITKRKGSYAEALKLRTIVTHDNAVTPPCKYAESCGGCRTQNLSYEAQLAAKEDQVHQLISRVGRFGRSEESGSGSYLKPILPCANQYHYRNKMEFSFGTRWLPPNEFVKNQSPDIKEDFALGLHVPGSYDKILDIRECLLQHDVANQILLDVHTFCETHRNDLSAYDTKTHSGFLRHLTLRSGHDEHTGKLQVMVNIVTSVHHPRVIKPLIEKLVTYSEVTSIVNNVTSSMANTGVGEKQYLLYGAPAITERLRGLVFEISANSFFQTNTSQAEVLYEVVEKACNLTEASSEMNMLDLFCGTGTIGLSMANKVNHVYGYELVQEAVANARRNANRNNILNATFIQGDLNKLTSGFGANFPRPDIIIADPNRPGMHPKLLQFILKSGAARVVYVSCNPATCARDLDVLCHSKDGSDLAGGYRLLSVQPIDMFPHTPHVECVCALELSN